MKEILKKIAILAVVLFSLNSCLKYGLDDLPEYKDCEITGVPNVIYRYISSQVEPSSGEYKVIDVALDVKYEVDAENTSVKVEVTRTKDFPVDQESKLSKSNLVLVLGISTGARISPVGDAPTLGVPGDWSGLNQYEVEAASGDKKVWTVEVTSLK